MSINLSNNRSVGFRACRSIRTVGRLLFAVTILVVLEFSAAFANPDVWVQTGMIFRFEDGKVTGVSYDWAFDEFFSSRTIASFDADGDGELEPAETVRLRREAFDPLAEFSYFVHVWEGDQKRNELEIESFAADVDEGLLVYRFTVALTPPVDPVADEIIASLHDESIFVDFRFREKEFLLVEGAMDPGCRFRIARGRGAQSGHRQTVSLYCGG